MTGQGWQRGPGAWSAQWKRVRQQVIARDGNTCAHCGTTVHRRCNPKPCNQCRQVGHIIAKADGGPDHPDNCHVVCRGCNLRGPVTQPRNQPAPAPLKAPTW